METVRKIDFFGGLHGNYLELAINHAIDQNSYDITLPQFDKNGACHEKNIDVNYRPITISKHYSFLNSPFHKDDLVIRIVPEQEDMLIAITNSFLRAGDQKLDIDNLEINTTQKIQGLPKISQFLQLLIRMYGPSDQYPRHALRKLFYSMFDNQENGINMMTNWQPAVHCHNFTFSSFFNLDYFFESLQKVAKFVNMEFLPTRELVNLHLEFLRLNQGYHSYLKCNDVMESIISGKSLMLNLNILEEAWINYRISKTFNLYDVPELETDTYPINTKIISELCFNKEKNA